jgi:hypothetical protein
MMRSTPSTSRLSRRAGIDMTPDVLPARDDVRRDERFLDRDAPDH